jgi:hypothetical protein
MRYAAQQLEVANRLLEPSTALSAAPADLISAQQKPNPDLKAVHLPSTVVIQLPTKSKRKPRRTPPAA